MTIGIYKIENKVNGKVYIGKSEVSIEERWKTHIRKLRNDNHRCSNGKRDKLQNAWNKYGEENFIFEVIKKCLPEECNKQEIKHIAKYNSLENGYNQTKGGDGVSGYKWSEKQRQQISENTKKAFQKPEVKKRHSNSMKGNTNTLGYHPTKETRKKISEKLKGEKHPRYIQRTPEMYEDVKNGIRRKDFLKKYNVSGKIWNSIKKELKKREVI